MSRTVSVLVEIPEELHEAIADFLEARPDWSQERVYRGALSLFAVQNGGNCLTSEQHKRAARVYLDSLFAE